MDLQKIKNFYTIKEKDNKLYINDKYIHIFSSTPLIFTFGNKFITTLELAKKDINCIITTNEDFYKSYFNLTDSEYRLKYYGLDDRSIKYLEAIKQNIGWLHDYDYDNIKHQYDYIKVENEETIKELINDVSIGKYRDIYVIQYCVQYAIDDYIIVKYFFNKKPKTNDLLTIDLIKSIERKLYETKSPYFKCWECGNDIHWLDIEGSLQVKADHLLEKKYCGC